MAASNVANKYNGTKAGEQKGGCLSCLGMARVQWVGSRWQAGGMDGTRGSKPPLGAGAELLGSNCSLRVAGDVEDIYKWSNTGPCMDIFAPVSSAAGAAVKRLRRAACQLQWPLRAPSVQRVLVSAY